MAHVARTIHLTDATRAQENVAHKYRFRRQQAGTSAAQADLERARFRRGAVIEVSFEALCTRPQNY